MIGYVALVLLLSVIRVAIDDLCRDRALAFVLCAAVAIVGLVALWRYS